MKKATARGNLVSLGSLGSYEDLLYGRIDREAYANASARDTSRTIAVQVSAEKKAEPDVER